MNYKSKLVLFAKSAGRIIITILMIVVVLFCIKFIAGQLVDILFWLNDLFKHPHY